MIVNKNGKCIIFKEATKNNEKLNLNSLNGS